MLRNITKNNVPDTKEYTYDYIKHTNSQNCGIGSQDSGYLSGWGREWLDKDFGETCALLVVF